MLFCRISKLGVPKWQMLYFRICKYSLTSCVSNFHLDIYVYYEILLHEVENSTFQTLHWDLGTINNFSHTVNFILGNLLNIQKAFKTVSTSVLKVLLQVNGCKLVHRS